MSKRKKSRGISPPVFKVPETPGFIFDDRNGAKKFYGGRKKDRSLASMDSWQDKKKEQELWAAVKSGKRFVEKENHSANPRVKIKLRKKKDK